MQFKKKLPEPKDLRKIAKSVEIYPTSLDVIIRRAKEIGYNEDTIAFLQLFKKRDGGRFKRRDDFYTAATELAMLICEEREQPKEGTLSLQG